MTLLFCRYFGIISSKKMHTKKAKIMNFGVFFREFDRLNFHHDLLNHNWNFENTLSPEHHFCLPNTSSWSIKHHMTLILLSSIKKCNAENLCKNPMCHPIVLSRYQIFHMVHGWKKVFNWSSYSKMYKTLLLLVPNF